MAEEPTELVRIDAARMMLLLTILLGAGAFLPVHAQDQLILDSPTGQLNSVIVWGKYSLTEFSKVFPSLPSPVMVGPVGGCVLIPCKANEVVSFTADHAPAYKKVIPFWNGSPGPLNLAYPALVELRVKVWVICTDNNCSPGPLTPAIKDDIMTKLAGANALYASQNAGIRLNLNDPNLIISDQTGNAQKNTYRDFGSNCGRFPQLIDGILDKEAIKLYILRTVEGEIGRGKSCWWPNVAVFGYAFNAGLIAHEIGHNHWLRHAEEPPEPLDKGTKNIMHSLSSERAYLSEGEVYRMHFLKNSVINRVSDPNYFTNTRVPRPEARSCSDLDHLNPCPPKGIRLWVDP